MNPDPGTERVVQPELVGERRINLAAERQPDRAGTRRGPVRATVKAQRVGARLGHVAHPQQLEVLLRPDQAPVARPLPAMGLPGVEHPAVILEAPHRLGGVGHHAEDVIELEHRSP